MKTFNSLEEIKKYYNADTNTYKFMEKGELLDIKLAFNLSCNSRIIAFNIIALNITALNINARVIYAWDINAGDINAGDINARNINARDISYYAVCFAYINFECDSIQGRRNNSKHFCLGGEIIIRPKKSEKDIAIEKAEEKLKEAQIELEKAKLLN